MADESHLSAMLLDRLALGSLSAVEAEAARGHARDCPRCAAALAQLEQEYAHFRDSVLPRTLPAVRARADRGNEWWRRLLSVRLLVPVAAAAAATGLAFFMISSDAPSLLPPAEEAVGIKGGPVARLHVRRGPDVFTWDTGVSVRAGDQLRLEIEPAELSFLLVLGRDGSGAVSVYHPVKGSTSVRVAPGRQALPEAIELDDAPGPEEVFLFFSNEPLTIDAATALLRTPPRAGVTPQPPKGTELLRLVLPKEAP